VSGFPPRLVVATKNPDKLAEVRALLQDLAPGVTLVDDAEWPDVEETGLTLRANALLKARVVLEATGMAALADDTGLEVDALDGAPGVNTARFAGPGATYADNRAALLRALEGRSNRGARFHTVVVLAEPGGAETAASGVVEGRITTAERGDGGFGYDPIFEVEGITLAEMSEEAKNRISHRARALTALVDRLTTTGNGASGLV
jgi:XTP/dITP diphosphohydrolase